jgi:hypothetical protein
LLKTYHFHIDDLGDRQSVPKYGLYKTPIIFQHRCLTRMEGVGLCPTKTETQAKIAMSPDISGYLARFDAVFAVILITTLPVEPARRACHGFPSVAITRGFMSSNENILPLLPLREDRPLDNKAERFLTRNSMWPMRRGAMRRRGRNRRFRAA